MFATLSPKLDKVAAVIILYNPDISLLDRLLRSVIGQVERTYIIDNTPGSTADLSSFFDQYHGNISYIPLGDNKGIATAQNIGIRKCMDAGCSHVLLLDQDSALPIHAVTKLLAAEKALLRLNIKVGAVGPQFIDEKTGKSAPAIRHRWFRIVKLHLDMKSSDPVETDHLIASGALIQTSVLRLVGLMRDDLFIDWVDIEWGLRAKHKGYSSFYVPNVVMQHSVGDSAIRVFGRDVHLHSDVRNYYMLRNAVYLMRLRSMGWKWKINFAPRIPIYLFLYPYLSNNKRTNLRLVLRALLDGARGKLGGYARR